MADAGGSGRCQNQSKAKDFKLVKVIPKPYPDTAMNRSGKAIMKIKLSFLLVLPVISLTSYGADYGFRTYERGLCSRRCR